jgi:transposase InsO family protein
VTLALVDEAVKGGARLESACNEAGIDARTIQRWRRDPDGEDRRRGPRQRPGNALSAQEEQEIVQLLTSPEFVDLSPNQVVPKLADMNIYKASERTMYRVLKKRKLLAHRGRSLPSTRRRPPERRATGPRQAWSWDITYLRSPVRGMFWMLYMVVDVWSRKIVAARVHDRESDELAAALLTSAYHREGVRPGQLGVHSDNGAAMKGQTLLAKLRDLGVTSTFSRPHTSDDNPFSEALFRTMKYRPEYPAGRPFATVEAAQTWVDAFVRWYNEDHQHSAIRFVTPSERHDGREVRILENRHRVYEAARAQTPGRWSRQTRNWAPVPIVWLNPHQCSSRPAPAVHSGHFGGERRVGQGRRSAAGESASEPLTRPSTPRQSPSPTAAAT